MLSNKAKRDMEKGEVILYQPDETIQLEVRLEEESVWLTQVQIAELFGRKYLPFLNTFVIFIKVKN